MLNLNSVKNGFGFIACYDRLVDVCPCSNINRCDVVSRASIPTADTLKQVSLRSVSFLVCSADRTGMACSSRINRDSLNAHENRFVFNEASELIEPPRAEATTLRPANSYSLPNALQVFKGDSSVSVFGLSHQTLRDYMVDIFAELGFFSREPFEVSLRASASALLKVCSEFSILLSSMVNLLSRIAFSVTVICKKLQSEIHTKCSYRIQGRLFGSINNYTEVEDSFFEKEVGLSSDSVKSSFLVCSDAYGNFESAIEAEYADFFEPFPAKYSLVVNHCSMLLEGAEFVFISFVGFNNLAYGANSHLCGKPILFSDSIIQNFLESILVGKSVVVGDFGDVITGFIELFHGMQETAVLFLCWIKLYEKRQLHNSIERTHQYLNVSAFLPRLKPWASCEGFL